MEDGDGEDGTSWSHKMGDLTNLLQDPNCFCQLLLVDGFLGALTPILQCSAQGSNSMTLGGFDTVGAVVHRLLACSLTMHACRGEIMSSIPAAFQSQLSQFYREDLAQKLYRACDAARHQAQRVEGVILFQRARRLVSPDGIRELREGDEALTDVPYLIYFQHPLELQQRKTTALNESWKEWVKVCNLLCSTRHGLNDLQRPPAAADVSQQSRTGSIDAILGRHIGQSIS